jgi:hypothetical protein
LGIGEVAMKALRLIAAVLVAVGVGAVVAGPVFAKTRVVRRGHSIQRAIDASRPGDTVIVHPRAGDPAG